RRHDVKKPPELRAVRCRVGLRAAGERPRAPWPGRSAFAAMRPSYPRLCSASEGENRRPSPAHSLPAAENRPALLHEGRAALDIVLAGEAGLDHTLDPGEVALVRI